MLKRRIVGGFLFGFFMAGVLLLIEYFSRDKAGDLNFNGFYFPALVGGVLSSLVFGFFIGRLPKRRYEE